MIPFRSRYPRTFWASASSLASQLVQLCTRTDIHFLLCGPDLLHLQSQPDHTTHTNTHPHTANMEIEVLNPQSDVTLVLGKKGSPKTKIRVSSAVLSGVSRVFATMFRWESTSNASPFEIVLDDDNETALTHILRLCHARHEKLPQSPSPLELLQISIVADKYEIFTVLDFAMTIWLQRAGDSTDDHYDRCNLARVAFILRRDADFRKFTSLLVSQYGHAFTDLWDDADDLMPTRTYCKTTPLYPIIHLLMQYSVSRAGQVNSPRIPHGKHKDNG